VTGQRVDGALLEVSRLNKVFPLRGGFGRSRDAIHAVRDLDFVVKRHGSLAIVGESGSGKTTTARIIVGLEHATSGTVRFEGRDLTIPPRRADRRTQKREIQMVFQNPYASLNPRQTAVQTLGEVLAFHRVVKRRDRPACIVELLRQVGIDEREARRRPRELSGGQCQRIAIARALAVEPQLLVLDEAVSSLDVSTQAQILNLLADLRERLGLTMLMISHDLAVVRQVADDIIVMHEGVAVEQGTVESVLTAPQDPYTQRLIASVPAGPGSLAAPPKTAEARSEAASKTH
jgi:peptide/nickel transport system ATP-binding protein